MGFGKVLLHVIAPQQSRGPNGKMTDQVTGAIAARAKSGRESLYPTSITAGGVVKS